MVGKYPRAVAVPDADPPAAHREQSSVRLAELVAALSLATDLGIGQPMEHILRSCRLSLRLADELSLDEEDRAITYYVALLAWTCCHADAYEQAAWFGDEIALHADTYDIDMAGIPLLAFMLRHAGAGRSLPARARAAGALIAGGFKEIEGWDMSHCQLAGVFALRLGLDQSVADALLQVFERWDGKGAPRQLGGEDLILPVRIVHLCEIAEVFHRRGGVDGAIAVARKRGGTQFDPALAELFCANAPDLLGELEEESSWSAVIKREPALGRVLTGPQLDSALEAVADFADLKSPYFAGHSRAASAIAAGAAERLGLPAEEVTAARRAALVQDLGRLGVPNSIWDKAGPLAQSELERVRLHPYLTERILAAAPGLAPLGALAAQHHERLDGSGYPKGLRADGLGPAARILAAADVYQALVEPRPHRPARTAEDAARELRLLARGGSLDGEAVNAVLAASGHRVRARPALPAGLTPRELEVLQHLVRGRSNKEIAAALYVTPKTVANHVAHIYAKIDVSSRAGASLFAMQHGLLGSNGEA